MGFTKEDRQYIFNAEYRYQLERLEIAKIKNAPGYPLLWQEVAAYRERALALGQIDDLPPLPPE